MSALDENVEFKFLKVILIRPCFGLIRPCFGLISVLLDL
jgi:hypothetical protein